MTKKAEKGDVFANYSKTLDEMTDLGIKCGEDAKNASRFLSNCLASAKAACNASLFAANVTEAEVCVEAVNCSNFSQQRQCRETVDITHNGLRDLRRDKCLNPTFPGSFTNCMKFVKEQREDIIKSCVADIKAETSGTCSGIIEEAGSIIIPVTQMATVTTRATNGRSRKRFF